MYIGQQNTVACNTTEYNARRLIGLLLQGLHLFQTRRGSRDSISIMFKRFKKSFLARHNSSRQGLCLPCSPNMNLLLQSRTHLLTGTCIEKFQRGFTSYQYNMTTVSAIIVPLEKLPVTPYATSGMRFNSTHHGGKMAVLPLKMQVY